MDDPLRAAMTDLSPRTRDLLRRALVRDDVDRDVIALRACCATRTGGRRASRHHRLAVDIPDARRKVVRMLAEIDAATLSE